MSDGFQYVDLIFLGLIAAFVALRLRSMLGKGTGIDPRDIWKQATRETVTDKKPAATERERPVRKAAPEEEAAEAQQLSPTVASGLKAIRAADTSFSSADFISGAKLAFEWVVDAFAKGDRDKLRMLLSDERFQHFAEALEARSKDGLKHESTLVSILAADITEAQMQGTRAHLTMQFTSEQVSVARDKEGKVVSGDTSAIEKVIDVWTFERDTSSRDPNWKITAT
jgi:predicted lipid-binding transport protein (Tim44 family)